MSNSQLEDLWAKEQAADVAAALGISLAELEETDWNIEPVDSNDGVIYGYMVTFDPGSDPIVLSKISGLVDGQWVKIGPLPDSNNSDD